jgi:MFS family permease
MSAGPLVAALSGYPAGRLVDRFGAGRATFSGLIVMAVGCVLLSAMPPSSGVPGYIAPIVIVTAGYALFQAANNTSVMISAGREQRGVVAGMLSLSRNLGLITGASAMGAIFARASAAIDITTARPDAVAAGMRITFACATLIVVVAQAIKVGSGLFSRRQILPISRPRSFSA